jgi:hypothetical protein
MGSCNTSTNCNPCGPDFNAINQLATRAGAYARQANTYAVDAENSWLEFNALYLGAFAVAPTVDNEGSPLQVGALYWNSVSNTLFAWNGTAWATATNFNEFTPFLANGTTTARNLVTREADVVNVKDFGAVGDGVTDDTAALQASINYCVANNKALFWPDGEYVTTGNLTSYWTIPHIGFGQIKRGSDTWYITPTGTQRNILYVNAAGNSANDGFTASESLPMSAAITRFRDLGAKASGGIWRIQIQGTITWNGVRVRDWPAFANNVEIFGEAADLNSVPTAVWDGTTATEPYAFRAENTNAVMYLHFRNIKFTNWSSGAIVVWASGKNLCENIHADNCPIGLWFRQNYTRLTHGVIENASTLGVSMQYSASGNVGDLVGGGVTFRNCARGVDIGRTTTAYTQGCIFDGNFTNCIYVTRNSRIRTQSNNFSSVNTAHGSFTSFVRVDLLSVWTPDNFTGSPDIYPSLSQTSPAFILESGSVHLHAQRKGARNVHIVSDGFVEISNENGNQILVSSYGSGNPSWVPFRLPSFYLYNREVVLDLDISLALNVGAGGTLALHGAGTSSGVILADIPIAPVASFTRGMVRMRAYNSGGTNTWRSNVEFPEIGFYEEKSTVSFNQATIRTNSEALILFRLYWTPSSNDTATFINMRSYVEG